MSWFSKALSKLSKNKTVGNIVGASTATVAPMLSMADLAGKSVKGLDNPFFKGAAQGSRLALGTGALVGGAMVAAPAAASTTDSTTPAMAGVNGATTASEVSALNAPAEGLDYASLLDSGMEGFNKGNSSLDNTNKYNENQLARKRARQEAFRQLLNDSMNKR